MLDTIIIRRDQADTIDVKKSFRDSKCGSLVAIYKRMTFCDTVSISSRKGLNICIRLMVSNGLRVRYSCFDTSSISNPLATAMFLNL